MGTSQVARAPPTRKWKRVTSAVLERNASSIISNTMKIAMPMIPASYFSIPALSAVSEGIRFAWLVKNKGLERAVKIEGIRLAETFVAAGISITLWKIAAAKVDNKLVNSPFGRLAEDSFKKTIFAIIEKGAGALEV